MSSTGATGFGYAPDMLNKAVRAHKPHTKSLKDEESTEAYNEEDAREAFGDAFIVQLKKDQAEFKGDWWQLAFLIKNLDEDKENPPISDERRLNTWNKWCRGRAPSTRGYIHLEHANLEKAHLEYAKLSYAHLEHAQLVYAHLEDTNLEHAELKEAQVREANLERAYLANARLEHACLDHARLEHASLWRAHLEHAVLGYANLEHANLVGAHLEHANLQEADLDGADVRWAVGLRFDGNRVEGIRIEGNAPDPWSVLRRKYTGPWFFVHLLLLAIFFAPYVGHALYLTAKSQFQEWSMEQYNALGDRLDDVPGLPDYHAELQRQFLEKHEQRRAVWVLLGLHRGVVPVALAVIIVLYNGMRGFLTLRVSLLRDAEERSNITPLRSEYESLRKTHQVAKYVLWAAVTAVLCNTAAWAVQTWIWVPVRS